MPRRSRRGAAALLCAATLVTAGCTPQLDWTTSIVPSWVADVQLLSDPVILDDIVLAYTVGSDGDEQIRAWRLDNGELLWRQTVLPGTTPRSVDHSIAALEDDGRWLVAALVPQDGHHELSDWSRFIVLDASTGAPAYPQLSAMSVWGERPFVCDDERAFCVEEQHTDNSGKKSLLTLRPGDDRLRVAEFDGTPFEDGGFAIGAHVNVKDGELRYGIDGSTLWTRDYVDVFGVGASTDAGWAWRETDDTDDPWLVGVGYDASDYPDLDYDAPFDAELPLGVGTVVGLNPETGATIWQLHATEPCAVEDHHLAVYDDVAVLCRFSSGEVSWHWDGTTASDAVYADVEQEMLGVDISTGEVLWRHDLDDVAANHAPALFGGARFLSDDEPIVVIDGTAQIVDLHNGKLTPIDKHGTLLCSAPPTQVELTSVWKDPTFLTADVYQLCDVESEPSADGVLSRASLSAAGFADDDPAAINTVDGLSVYPAED